MKFEIEIISKADSDAKYMQCYCFNEPDFFCTPTNNGSGPGSIRTTYKDSFSGILYNKIIAREVVINKIDLLTENAPEGYTPFMELLSYKEIMAGEVIVVSDGHEVIPNKRTPLKSSKVANKNFCWEGQILLTGFDQIGFEIFPGMTATLILHQK